RQRTHLKVSLAGVRESRASLRHSRQRMAPRWPSMTGETPSQSVRQKSQLMMRPSGSMRCMTAGYSTEALPTRQWHTEEDFSVVEKQKAAAGEALVNAGGRGGWPLLMPRDSGSGRTRTVMANSTAAVGLPGTLGG